MNKEGKEIIERIEDTFYSNTGKEIKHFQKVTLYEEGITDILKLLNFVEKQQKELQQKESILDKVTDKLKEDIKKYNKELMKDSIMSIKNTDLTGRILQSQKILNIIEGENHE